MKFELVTHTSVDYYSFHQLQILNINIVHYVDVDDDDKGIDDDNYDDDDYEYYDVNIAYGDDCGGYDADDDNGEGYGYNDTKHSFFQYKQVPI